MEPRQDRDRVVPEGSPLGGRKPGQAQVGQHPARDVAHHVERGPDDRGILAQHEGLRDGHGRALERGDHPELPLDRVGGRQELPRRLPAEHVVAARARGGGRSDSTGRPGTACTSSGPAKPGSRSRRYVSRARTSKRCASRTGAVPGTAVPPEGIRQTAPRAVRSSSTARARATSASSLYACTDRRIRPSPAQTSTPFVAEGALDFHAPVRREHDVTGPLLGRLGRQHGQAELHQPVRAACRPARGRGLSTARGSRLVEDAERAVQDVHRQERRVPRLEARAVLPEPVVGAAAASRPRDASSASPPRAPRAPASAGCWRRTRRRRGRPAPTCSSRRRPRRRASRRRARPRGRARRRRSAAPPTGPPGSGVARGRGGPR